MFELTKSEIEEALLYEFKNLCKTFYITCKGEFKSPYYYRMQGARIMLSAVGITYKVMSDIENEFKNSITE